MDKEKIYLEAEKLEGYPCSYKLFENKDKKISIEQNKQMKDGLNLMYASQLGMILFMKSRLHNSNAELEVLYDYLITVMFHMYNEYSNIEQLQKDMEQRARKKKSGKTN
jgi:hypothetical protein